MKSIFFFLFVVALSSCGGAQSSNPQYPNPPVVEENAKFPLQLTEAQWKQRLTDKQYYILRKGGTEPAGSGKYDHFYKEGTYYSAATLQPIFSSETKFDSGTGWPSFYAPISPDAVRLVKDKSFGMVRWEVVDKLSGSHLGHVFNDGPQPTGKRYCLNSDALIFVPKGGKPPEKSKAE